ncbi:MAG TPA: hypothetical protein PLA61_14945, partial [Ferruginibacter sp.]|nr:hypothetical protein [Ferruginibacter sp.]
MRKTHFANRCLYGILCLFLLSGLGQTTHAQLPKTVKPAALGNFRNEVANSATFIRNVGQYGQVMKGYEYMGRIEYGYEGPDLLALFSTRGVIFFQRKIEKLPHREERKLERQGLPEAEIEKRRKVTDRVITMEWAGARGEAQVLAEDKTTAYHTYGLIGEKAFGYRKITYRNMYPGIDIIYNFGTDGKPGFEYSLLVKRGADLKAVSLQYAGDIKRIKVDEQGNLVVRSDIDGIRSSVPVSYYGNQLLSKPVPAVRSGYTLRGKELRFSFPDKYDSSKDLIIDPFVSTTGSLAGLNAGKAKDVDFDYAGNIYVTGGGSMTTTHSLAKYNAAGVLQWTFNGTLSNPVWTFGTYYGGWMVEKPTGNVYLGQGFNPATGFQVIRVNTNGLYDNYITTPNPSFMEAWKMFWSCNNGSPQILIAGGGVNSNINFGLFTPPS